MLIYVLRWRPSWISDRHKKQKIQNASSLKPLRQLKPNCPGMIIGRSSTKFLFFYADRKFKMAATAGHKLTLVPMGKCSNAFFSETTNMIKVKLYMNVHWMVLYKLYVFCSDMKFKMAATAGLSLTLDPMGKMFQTASSLKPLRQLKPNCPGMIIGSSAVWFQLSKWFQRRNVLKHFPHRVQC
jgi:hypothetical protein